MESIIIGSISKHHKNGQSGWIYVALSRVTSIKGLFLTAPLEKDLTKYKPRNDVGTEMERLEKIQKNTLARLSTCSSLYRTQCQENLLKK